MHVSTEAFRASGPQELLAGIVEDARSLPIAAYENEPADILCQELVPAVRDLANQVLLVLDPLVDLDASDSTAEPVASTEVASRRGAAVSEPHLRSVRAFARRVDRLVDSSDAAGALGDLAFMACAELRGKLRALNEVDSDFDPWRIIDRVGSTVRKIVKTATAIDLVLGDCTGVHHLGFETELQVSLQARCAYGKFRRHVLDFEPTSAGTTRLEQRLNNAATAIARLIGRNVYLDLRVSDRLELRRLQKRLIAWTVESPRDELAGQRLLGDIVTFIELLGQINHRQELRESDRQVILELMDLLLDEDGAKPVATAALGRLKKLMGLDNELDIELCRHKSGTRIAEVKRALARLSVSFQSSPELPAGSGVHCSNDGVG